MKQIDLKEKQSFVWVKKSKFITHYEGDFQTYISNTMSRWDGCVDVLKLTAYFPQREPVQDCWSGHAIQACWKDVIFLMPYKFIFIYAY